MARINWQDEIVEKPRTYNVINNPDGTITLEPAKGEIYQEGTPVNAANLNTMGEDIEQLDTKVKTHLAEKASHGVYEDLVTGIDYKFGIEDGLLYIEKVVG